MFSCPAHYIFWIDIGLPYLAHGCITTVRCVVFIHDPDSMLTLDLKVKFKGFCHVRPVTSVSFDIGKPYLTHGSITIRECVKYIHDSDTTLNFDLKVKFLEFMVWLCVQTSAFCVFTKSYFVWHVSVSPWYDVSHTFKKTPSHMGMGSKTTNKQT